MKLRMLSAIVSPCESLQGTISVPGDKSISHRVAIFAALASGESVIDNFLESEDCLATLTAMESLGATSFRSEATGSIRIRGRSGKLLEPAGPLDAGNSGTSMRLLAGLLAGHSMRCEITGDASLLSRPMNRIKEPLEQMGAQIELLGEKGTGPIRIKGGNLKSIEYAVPVASAQVKSCILLAALYAKGTTTIVEPAQTRDHTERLLAGLGHKIGMKGNIVQVEGCGPEGPSFAARAWRIPGDFSSAAFHIVGAAAREGSKVTVKNVGLNPRRTALLDVLKRMGAEIDVKATTTPEDAEEVGDITVTGHRLKATEIGGDEIPNLIDELPLVAVLGALAHGETVIRDAAELRVKESDRISSMVKNLELMGVRVTERDDGMTVHGPARLSVPDAGVRSYGDHRVAMAMAVLGLYADKDLCVNNTACIDTSYPGFWNDVKSLGAHVKE